MNSLDIAIQEYGYTCHCCGLEMHSKYGEGGFIDHVLNFSNKFDEIVEYPIDRIIEEIAIDGTDYKDEYIIKERLECFKIYCTENGYIENGKIDIGHIEQEIEKIIDIENRIEAKGKEIIKAIHRDKDYEDFRWRNNLLEFININFDRDFEEEERKEKEQEYFRNLTEEQLMKERKKAYEFFGGKDK